MSAEQWAIAVAGGSALKLAAAVGPTARRCNCGGSFGSTTSSTSSSVVLVEADAAGLMVVAAEAVDATEDVVLLLGRQRPGLLVEAAQLYKTLLRRGFLVPCWSFPWWPAFVRLTTVPMTGAASSCTGWTCILSAAAAIDLR